MLTLRSNVGYPPGGLLYDDPRTPAARWKDDHTNLNDRTREVITFRSANPAIYPEPQWTEANFVRQQIVEFNCRRIGYNPTYCIEMAPMAFNAAQPQPTPAAPTATGRKCPKCQVDLITDFCTTCSGNKILGYHCLSCKQEFPA